MIVSTGIAVLPVLRSPMISSRWPRPIGIIESIALMPVWSGSFTGWRSTTPGALNSSGRRLGRLDRARPSSGWPSGSTTRPTSASPTGTLEDRARALDRLALLDAAAVAEERGADVVLLEVERDAVTPCSNSSISRAMAVLEAVDAGDAVADLEDGADLGEVGLDVVLLDPLLQDRGDLLRANRHVRSFSSPRPGSGRLSWSGSLGHPWVTYCGFGDAKPRSQRRPIHESRIHRPQ